MLKLLAGAALVLLSSAGPAAAVGMIADEDTPTATFEEARVMIEEGRYREAIDLLQPAASAQSDSPDLWSLLGFAYRKSGQPDKSFAAYNRALLIDPDHIGANEYLGELYLQVGDPERAKRQLRIVDDACVVGCPAFDQLKAAIEAYEAGKR